MLIGIVAHTARAEQVRQLKEQVGAAYVSIDNGALGCDNNHRKVWQYLADHRENHDWCIVLEDDAVPCNDFRNQLQQALTTAPLRAGIVSLYLGRQRPPQYQWAIEQAIEIADDHDASWLAAHSLIHAVGVAIRGEHVEQMLSRLTELPIDEAINWWAHNTTTKVFYTHPSLVDHADTDTLVEHRDGHRREPGRKAWRHGTREHWTTTQTPMSV